MWDGDVLLLASGDLTTTVAGGLIGVVGGVFTTFIPLWWKHRQDKVDLAAAKERERKLEEALAGLQFDPPPDETDKAQEEKAMEERIINAVKVFVNKTVGDLRQEVTDLKSRVATLEKQLSSGGVSPPPPPPPLLGTPTRPGDTVYHRGQAFRFVRWGGGNSRVETFDGSASPLLENRTNTDTCPNNKLFQDPGGTQPITRA
jgi:hypothetical protein